MTVSYNFTREDNIHFNMYLRNHSPTLKKSRITSTALVALIPMLFGLGLSMRDRNIAAIVISSVVAVSSLLWFPKYCDRTSVRYMNKLLDESKDASLSARTVLTLQPEGIYIEQDKANATLKWNGVEKVESSASHTFLYTGAANAIVIPNTAFESVAEREKFMDMVMQYRENAAGLSAEMA